MKRAVNEYQRKWMICVRNVHIFLLFNDPSSNEVFVAFVVERSNDQMEKQRLAIVLIYC